MKKIIIGLIIVAISLLGFKLYTSNASADVEVPVDPVSASMISIDDLYSLVNSERLMANLNPLVLNSSLNSSALDKCNDMASKKYWQHVAPDGTKPSDFIYGRYPQEKIKAVGENQASGSLDAKSVIAAFMSSHGHKENILDPDFDTVGYAVCKADDFQNIDHTLIVVQHFIQSK